MNGDFPSCPLLQSSDRKYEGIRYTILIGVRNNIYTNVALDGMSSRVRGSVDYDEVFIVISGA